uniref:Uncharacterized protein n=1 Tax=viral metagenome TaxID=1070528 RepID=A0A6M3M1J5_9ZZZZ
MTSQQTSLQINEATQEQYRILKLWGFGTRTHVTRTAVDRMFNTEAKRRGWPDCETESATESMEKQT